MLRRAILILLVALCGTALAQDSFPLNELKFMKFFGQRADDKTTYCLLGNGFFRTISSNEEDTIIRDWIGKHPNARAVPVSIIGESSRMPITYIWAVDGSDNLNLQLIKQGAFPASVMLDAVHFDALSKGTRNRAAIEAGAAYARKMNPSLPQDEDAPPRRLVPNPMYEVFLKELVDVEISAQTNKAGIWSDKLKELQDK